MLSIYRYKSDIPYGSNSYLLSNGGEYAIIDPSVSYERVLAEHPDVMNGLKYILITHAHFDHILFINEWAEHCKEVIVGEADGASLSSAYNNCYLGFLGVEDGYYGNYRTVKEGDRLSLGDISLEVIDCPGHTPGGVSYKCKTDVFVGDTLFEMGGYGRCDLPGGDIDKLEQSLIKLITKQADDTIFYPGHGGPTTLVDAVKYFS